MPRNSPNQPVGASSPAPMPQYRSVRLQVDRIAASLTPGMLDSDLSADGMPASSTTARSRRSSGAVVWFNPRATIDMTVRGMDRAERRARCGSAGVAPIA